MGGGRIEFICPSVERHAVRYLIISMINCVIDVIMVPYPHTVIFHTCNVISLERPVLYCETLMSCNSRQSLKLKFSTYDTLRLMETTEAFKVPLQQLY